MSDPSPRKIDIALDNLFKSKKNDSRTASVVRKTLTASSSFKINHITTFFSANSKKILIVFIAVSTLILLFLFLSPLFLKKKPVAAPIKKVSHLTLNEVHNVKCYSKFFSSPVIHDFNGDGRLDFGIGDMHGAFHCYDGPGFKKIFQFNLESGILASPIVFKFTKSRNAAMVLSERGEIYLLDGEGSYFYARRKEYPSGYITAKPCYLESEQSPVVVLATREGVLFAIEPTYGRLIWVNEDTKGYGAEFFASPVAIDLNGDNFPDIVAASMNKYVIAVDGKTGKQLWYFQLKNEIKSSPVILSYSNLTRESAFVIDVAGNGYIFGSETGKILWNCSIGARVSATPAVGNFTEGLGDEIVIATYDGEVLLIEPSSKKVIRKYSDGSRSPFLASPVLADFNIDKIPDLLVCNSSGLISVVDGKTFSLWQKFQASAGITSTPAVGDISGTGNMSIVVGLEDGSISVISVDTIPTGVHKVVRVLSSQFLFDSKNSSKFF